MRRGQLGRIAARSELDVGAEAHVLTHVDGHGHVVARIIGHRLIIRADRYMETIQQPATAGLLQFRAARHDGIVEQGTRLVQPRRAAEHFRRQRLLRQSLVVMIGRENAERIGRRLRRAKGRQTDSIQPVPLRPHRGIAQETGNDGLGGRLGKTGQAFGGTVHVRQGIGCDQHQHAIHIGVTRQRAQRLLQSGGVQRRMADDGIVQCRPGFQHGGQFTLGLHGQIGPRHRPAPAHDVQRQVRRTIAIGKQGDATTALMLRVDQDFQRRKELNEKPDPHGTGPPHQRIEHGIGGRTGVETACFQDDDRLDAGRGHQRAGEPPGRVGLFQIQHNAVGARIHRQVFKDIGHGDAICVTRRHHR